MIRNLTIMLTLALLISPHGAADTDKHQCEVTASAGTPHAPLLMQAGVNGCDLGIIHHDGNVSTDAPIGCQVQFDTDGDGDLDRTGGPVEAGWHAWATCDGGVIKQTITLWVHY